MRLLLPIALLLALLPAAAAETHTVTVSDFAFSPAVLEIEVGDTVVFIWNNTVSAHNVAEVDDADANDYNCDGSVGYEDIDADGFAACEDCDDNDATAFAGGDFCPAHPLIHPSIRRRPCVLGSPQIPRLVCSA